MRDRHRLPPGSATFALLCVMAAAIAWAAAFLIVRGLLG